MKGLSETDEWLHDSNWRQRFRRKLVKWYRSNARDLPWRRTDDPYRIWVSEVMLQQTQVETVKPYYHRFLKEFPTVRKLAEATEEQVLRQWEGLGYYRRARQLHAAARIILNEYKGRFPTEFEQVLALPGIGRYTAGAVLSFARNMPHPIVEANTIRLYSRLLCYDEDPTKGSGQKLLWAFAESLLSKKNPGELNQALIELGGCICKPRSPICRECPVASLCAARLNGRVEEIPVPKKKLEFENVIEAAIVVQSRGEVLIRKCQPGERWAGLWDFPRFSVEGNRKLKSTLEKKVKLQTGNNILIQDKFRTIKHGVTRFRIELLCFHAVLDGRRGRAKSNQKWVKIHRLDEYPLSVTGRKISDGLQRSSP